MENEKIIYDSPPVSGKPLRFDILKLKHWHLDLLFIAVVIPFEIAVTSVARIFSLPWPGGTVVMVLYLAYPVLTWHRLNQLLASEKHYERTEKRTVIIAVVAVLFASMIAGLFPYEPLRYAVGVAYLFLLCFIFALPAKQLKSIELKRNAGIWEYIPDAFNFFMWPSLGVFFLQPRLNRVLEKRIVIEE